LVLKLNCPDNMAILMRSRCKEMTKDALCLGRHCIVCNRTSAEIELLPCRACLWDWSCADHNDNSSRPPAFRHTADVCARYRDANACARRAPTWNTTAVIEGAPEHVHDTVLAPLRIYIIPYIYIYTCICIYCPGPAKRRNQLESWQGIRSPRPSQEVGLVASQIPRYLVPCVRYLALST
jgi:hypothetical protein